MGENDFERHPAIIISNDLVYEVEGKYYAVMLSAKVYDLPTEYHLTPDDFTHRTDQSSIVKCHLIAEIYDGDITKKYGSVKNQSFEKVTQHIFKTTFGTEVI